MKKLIVISLMLSLVGCGLFPSTRKSQFQESLATWPGQTTEHLIEVWGIPDQTFENNGKKYFAYVDDSGTSGLAFGSRKVAVGSTSRDYCKTTFTIENNKVVSYQSMGTRCH